MGNMGFCVNCVSVSIKKKTPPFERSLFYELHRLFNN